jgi:glucose-1-phosphate thymidylyltransferase
MYLSISMKGVLLAGGLGTRLNPCTLVVNKHLLPIYDQPMIYYPIQTLVKSGCTDLLIVSGTALGDIAKLVGNGRAFGLKTVYYAFQEKADGIAGALKLAETFIGQEKFMMILGDNILFDDLSVYTKAFQTEDTGSCKLFIKKIPNPSAFGVAEIHDGKITNIIEKPIHPPTDYAVIGVYLYDHHVFEMIKGIKPSPRGELEITDVNMTYVRGGSASYAILESEWIDSGTFKSLAEANQIVAKMRLTETHASH